MHKEGTGTDCEVRSPGFKSHLCHFSASDLLQIIVTASFNLSFLICKVGILIYNDS